MVASKKIYGQDDNQSSNNVHSLLSFMNLASNKVKSALEKPNTFKRNINHRRFLQKQFRTIVKSPEKGSSKKSFAKGNIDSMNFTLREYNGQSYPPPLNHNFLQFNALQTSRPNLSFADPNFTIPFERNADFGVENLSERQISCNGLTRKQSSCLYQAPDAEYSSNSSTPELILEEDFLTCEELTQAIELEDLFIPDADLSQYLLNGKENIGDFYNNDGSLGINNWQGRGSFGLQEDILVF